MRTYYVGFILIFTSLYVFISPYRELYYQEIQVVQNQRTLDQVLLIICNLLECPPWELGIIATSKGLVAGPLLVKTEKSIIDCSSPGGLY